MLQAIRAAFAVQTSRLSRTEIFRISTLRRFARRSEGVAAVEFGMVAAPFLALMFAAWRFIRRMVERQFRFSIREMLVGVAAIAVFIATFGRWWLSFSHEYSALSAVRV